MEFSQVLEKRRSIRKYAEARISEKEIEELIDVCRKAPSWKNSQTARYYAAISDEAIAAVAAALPAFNQNSSKNAAYIVSSFRKGQSGLLKPDEMAEEGDLWGSYDLGLSNMHLLLKASEMGYDTLVMGIRDTESLRKFFEIPEDEIIMPVIAIGKRDGDAVMKSRKELSEILKIR